MRGMFESWEQIIIYINLQAPTLNQPRQETGTEK